MVLYSRTAEAVRKAYAIANAIDDIERARKSDRFTVQRSDEEGTEKTLVIDHETGECWRFPTAARAQEEADRVNRKEEARLEMLHREYCRSLERMLFGYPPHESPHEAALPRLHAIERRWDSPVTITTYEQAPR